MKEVEEVCDRRPEPLDLQPINRVDVADDLLGGVATRARVEKPPESPLIVRALVYVGDAKLGLPQKGVIGAFEDLALLGNGMDDGLERRSTVGDAERAALDFTHHLGDAAADRPEVLQPLIP
jgi:hypothetical protein